MKILCITPFMVTGGAERIVYYIAVGMREPVHTVTVASTMGYYVDLLRNKSVDFHEVKTLARRSPLALVRSVWNLSRLIRKEHFELINAHSYLTTCIAFFASVLAGRRCPIVFTIHIPERDWYLKVMGMTLNWMVHHIITVCDDMKKELIAYSIAPEKISVFYNGVDISKFSYKERRCPGGLDCKIGVVARLVERKGHMVLLDALKILKNSSPGNGLALFCAGNGPYKETLVQAAREKGLVDSVHFMGDVRDIPAFLESMDLFVLPSFFEGFPVSIVEALAAGLPVVATRVNGVPEIIEDGKNGILVDPDNAPALAAAIQRISENRGFYGSTLKNNRKLVEEKFSLQAMRDNYWEKFLDLAQKSG